MAKTQLTAPVGTIFPLDLNRTWTTKEIPGWSLGAVTGRPNHIRTALNIDSAYTQSYTLTHQTHNTTANRWEI